MKKLSACLSRPAKLSGLIVGVLVLGSHPAHAEDGSAGDPSSRAGFGKLSDEGFTLYKARDYRHAAEKFLQAYAVEQDPNLLFNVARCYEAMGDSDNAIEKYETFLAKPDADPQGKRRATDAIRKLRQAKVKVREPSPPAHAAATGQPPQNASGTETENRRPSEPEKGSFLSAPVLILGAGVLVAGAGAVAYAMGSRDHSMVTGSAGYASPGQVDPMTEAEARRLVESGDTKKLIGVIGLGVGAALVATSAALFAFGHHNGASKEPAALAFGVSPTGGGGQFLLEGRF